MAHGEALRIRVIKAVVEDGLSRNAAAHINPLDHFLAFGIYEGVPQLTTACSSDAAMRSFETAYGRLPLAAARCS